MASDDGVRFLERLGEEANAVDILDRYWWMALERLEIDGWQVIPPKDDEEGDSGD